MNRFIASNVVCCEAGRALAGDLREARRRQSPKTSGMLPLLLKKSIERIGDILLVAVEAAAEFGGGG